MSDDAARTADGRLFHARGAATENDRSPRVIYEYNDTFNYLLS